MKFFLIATVAFYNAVAFSYEEGRYSCKNNHQDLPDNVYVIKNVSVGVDGDKLPFVEGIRFSRKNLSDPNSEVVKSTIRGLATVFSSEVLPETLTIGAVRLQFFNKEMVGCIK